MMSLLRLLGASSLLALAAAGLGCAHGTVPTVDDGEDVDDGTRFAVGAGPSAGLAAALGRVGAAPDGGAAPTEVGPAAWSDGPACSDATQYVYVLSAEGEIHRFWPPTLTFERVGRPSCLPEGAAMFSMAVDRHARAFALAQDQIVYQVDLATGACEPTAVDRSTAGLAFRHFGMAYVADPTSPDGETLFVREAWVGTSTWGFGGAPDPGTRRLATLDPRTGRLALRGTGEGVDADLTGTGDGKLYGFFVSGEVGQIDVATGALATRFDLGGLQVEGGWAVAAWGGDLWVFSSVLGETTRAHRFHPSTGQIDLVSDQAGFEVVGAGVSTCAPTAASEPEPVEPPS